MQLSEEIVESVRDKDTIIATNSSVYDFVL